MVAGAIKRRGNRMVQQPTNLGAIHQGFEGGQELSGCGSVGLVAQRQQAGHGYMRSAGIVGLLHGRLLGSTRMLAILSQLDLLGRGD